MSKTSLSLWCGVRGTDQRLDDVRYWEKEVDDKLSTLKQETEALEMFRNRINAAIEAYQEPLHIAQLCLANRSAQHSFTRREEPGATLPLSQRYSQRWHQGTFPDGEELR